MAFLWQKEKKYVHYSVFVFAGPDICHCANVANSSYWCERRIDSRHNYLYCKFVTHFVEYFDMRPSADPWQVLKIFQRCILLVHDYQTIKQTHTSSRQFRKRWRQPQIWKFCGGDGLIGHKCMYSVDGAYLWPRLLPYMSIVPAKHQDLWPSPSFTKLSIATRSTLPVKLPKI